MKGILPSPSEETPSQHAAAAVPSSAAPVGENAPAAKPAAGAPLEVPGQGEARVQAAFVTTSRTEASLSTLMRAIQSLSAGVNGAREANVQLVHELELLREMLGSANEHQLALRNRIISLERALELGQEERARERVFLTEQHDAFIASLIEDHERMVATLGSKLDEAAGRAAPTAPPGREAHGRHEAALRAELEAARRDVEKLVGERDCTRETLLRLQAQRDEAQASVVRAARERDQARAELAQLKIQQGMSDAIREAGLPESRPKMATSSANRPTSSPSANPRPLSPGLSSLPKPALGAIPPNQRATASNAPTVAPPPRSSPTSSIPPERPVSSPVSSPAPHASLSNLPKAPDASVGSMRITAPMPPDSAVRPTAAPPELKSAPRKITPPAELRAALTNPLASALEAPAKSSPMSAPPPSENPPSSLPLRSKPDPSTRPLVGYSLTEAAEERVDTSRITPPARTPQR